MNIKEMHYDFKQKLNKIDSQQYRNLKVPEIDWKLNEAISLFIKIVAEPKYATRLGFETSQRTIDDIRTIVKNDKELIELGYKGSGNYSFELPEDYQYYVGGAKMLMTDGDCVAWSEKIIVRQHDDDFQNSEFDKSSFLWREVNIRFYDKGIKVFTSSRFVPSKFNINYIRQQASVNNSENYVGGQYKTLTGIILDTNVDCDLPPHTHREIVDIAVAITTGDLQISDYQIKMTKLGLNQLV